MRRALVLGLFVFPIAASVLPASETSSRHATLTTGPLAHAVVLSNGSLLPTRARPNTLFGVVSFLTLDGTAVSLPASAVDIPATLAREARWTPGSPSRQVWDERAVASLTTRFEGAESHSSTQPRSEAATDSPDGDMGADAEAMAENLAAQEELPSATPLELQTVNDELVRLQGELARAGANTAQTHSLREREAALTAQAQGLREASGLAEELPPAE